MALTSRSNLHDYEFQFISDSITTLQQEIRSSYKSKVICFFPSEVDYKLHREVVCREDSADYIYLKNRGLSIEIRKSRNVLFLIAHHFIK